MAHACRRKGGFATRMTGTDNDHVIYFVVSGHKSKKGTRHKAHSARKKKCPPSSREVILGSQAVFANGSMSTIDSSRPGPTDMIEKGTFTTSSIRLR